MPKHGYPLSIDEKGRVLLWGASEGVTNPPHTPADTWAESALQEYPLGTVLWEPNQGRFWRYAQNGAVALDAAVLVQKPIVESNADHTDMAVDTPAIGDVTVTVTNGGNTAIVVNEFKDGWLHVNDGTGEGHAYRIKSHPAAATSATCAITLYDEDPIVVAFVAATTVSLTNHPGYKVIVNPAPTTGKVYGVTNMAITAAYFFWAQYKGPAAVKTDGSAALANGMPVRASEDDDGAVALTNWDESGVNDEQAGICLHANADGEHSLIYLTMD